jgi:hypothetical protein
MGHIEQETNIKEGRWVVEQLVPKQVKMRYGGVY